MSQQDVYDILKRYRNKWLSANEIAKKLKASPGSVITSLMRLRKSKLVNFKSEKRQLRKAGRKKVYVYRFKR